MKTNRIFLLVATFLLIPWCAAPLFAQQSGQKKIVITKRTVDGDGSQSTETIVKKGAAAENFDLEKYLRENRSDNTRLEVKVTGGDDNRTIVIKGSKSVEIEDSEEADEADEEDSGDNGNGYNGYPGYEGYAGYNSCSDNSTFLGVDEDSDEDPDQAGLVVNVVRGSAADLAGLRDNDKIMKLNDTPTNKWSDLSKFVNASKPGDKVRIAYERNGKAASTEATLIKRSELKCDKKCEPKGFLGVSDIEERDENDEAGVAVSITKGSGAEKAGLQKGDVIFQLNDTPIADFEDISDFMAYTKKGDKINITYERNGKRNTTEATLTDQQSSWNINTDNWSLGDLDPEKLLNNAAWNNGNCSVNVRAKDACLGIFSDANTDAQAVGSKIVDFTDESAANEANMLKGDVILSINGQKVNSHDDIWNEIAKYKVGDKVKIEYLREGKTMSAEPSLKACRDNSSRVQILDGDGDQVRNFTSWNWNEDDQRNLRERSIITIRRGEGDAPIVNANPNGQAPALDRSLKLRDFKAYPNPTQGQITVEFSGEAVATTVSFFDLSGRQLFREELNAFDGRYNQQFDLADYSKGNIMIQVVQGDKVFTEQMIVN